MKFEVDGDFHSGGADLPHAARQGRSSAVLAWRRPTPADRRRPFTTPQPAPVDHAWHYEKASPPAECLCRLAALQVRHGLRQDFAQMVSTACRACCQPPGPLPALRPRGGFLWTLPQTEEKVGNSGPRSPVNVGNARPNPIFWKLVNVHTTVSPRVTTSAQELRFMYRISADKLSL